MQPTNRYPTLVGSYLIKPPLAACHIPPIILLILKFGGWQHPDSRMRGVLEAKGAASSELTSRLDRGR